MVKKILPNIIYGIIMLTPLTGLVSVIYTLYQLNSVPSDVEFIDSSNYVRKNFKDGDIIRFAPSWGLEGLPYFKDLEVDLHDDFEIDELLTYKRLWMVTHLDERRPKVPSKFKLIEHKNFQRVDIYLYEIPFRGKPSFDFLENLGEAKVIRKWKNKKEEQCTTWREKKWYCEISHEWKFVGDVIRDVSQSRRRVIWAHALEEGNPLQIIYENVPWGKEVEIFYGLTQRSFERAEGSPVIFEVFINEKKVFETQIPQNDKIWHKRTINLKEFRGEKLKILFQVIAQNNSWRQFCFKGRIWK